MVQKSFAAILVLISLVGCTPTIDSQAKPLVVPVNAISASSVQIHNTDTSAVPQEKAEWELDAFSRVDISVELSDVSIRPADSYGIELLWYDPQLNPTYRVDNGTLVVTSPEHGKLSFDKEVPNGQIIVYLPEAVHLDKVSVKTDMGSIQIADKEIGVLTIECDAGKAVLNRVSAQTMELSNEMGSVSVYDSTVTNTVTVNCDAGNIILNRVSAEDVKLSNKMGSVMIDSSTGVKATDIQCDAGDIEITGDIQGKINLNNDMGHVIIKTTTAAESINYNLTVDMGTLLVDGREYKEHFTQNGEPYSLGARTKAGNMEVYHLTAIDKEATVRNP